MFILLLAASLPLPALASSPGQPHCQTMQQAADDTATAPGTHGADAPCDCSDGVACRMPCAVGGIAVVDAGPGAIAVAAVATDRMDAGGLRPLPAHADERYRPPLYFRN